MTQDKTAGSSFLQAGFMNVRGDKTLSLCGEGLTLLTSPQAVAIYPMPPGPVGPATPPLCAVPPLPF